MRQRDKTILWPVYFDSTKSRSQGRRVPKKLAVPAAKISQLQAALEKLRIQYDLVVETAHPRSPWRKIGYISVSKKGSKNSLLRKIAENLLRTDP